MRSTNKSANGVKVTKVKNTKVKNARKSKSTGKVKTRSPASTAGRSPAKRNHQACLLCHQQKTRCDGVLPACANCKKRGYICILVEGKKRGRPARDYTLSDLAPADQPVPVELQTLMDNHGNATLADLAKTELSGTRPPHLQGLLNPSLEQ
ncbi:hypothetical protein LPJ53_000131 [Coemansia erecta]|uniref:Zn(2)-C6 fungal-type domain-containing protein n=1 Tax=Coemansia erecta TaxID=147472 RepID=A0A9W8CW84_9FUNG|nr:hypothetical protein LPJ53_000131 [Coemansia erecta]